MREGVKLWDKMIADFPREAEWRKSLAEAHHQLVTLLVLEQRFDDAVQAFPELIRQREELIRENPKVPEFQADLGATWSWRAFLHEKQKQPEQAAECLTKAITHVEAAARLNPRQRDWLELTRLQLTKRAQQYAAMNKPAEQSADLERARDLEKMLEEPLLRLIRLRHQLSDHKVAATLSEAEDLYHNVDLAGGQWHELAEIYACCGRGLSEAQHKETAAVRAVACLRRALDNGHVSVVPAADNPNFQTLVERADFRQVVGRPK
jgi:tetratricopeptide (TPR) repeat protein